jgi:hypothetical protein
MVLLILLYGYRVAGTIAPDAFSSPEGRAGSEAVAKYKSKHRDVHREKPYIPC